MKLNFSKGNTPSKEDHSDQSEFIRVRETLKQLADIKTKEVKKEDPEFHQKSRKIK